MTTAQLVEQIDRKVAQIETERCEGNGRCGVADCLHGESQRKLSLLFNRAWLLRCEEGSPDYDQARTFIRMELQC